MNINPQKSTIKLEKIMKKYTRFLFCLLTGAIVFTACDDTEIKPKDYIDVQVADGVLILNEGSYFNKIDGSLDFLSYANNTLTMNRNVFRQINGRALGGTPNHAIRCGSKIYIATTDENRIEVLDATTLKALTPITLTAPRELCTDGASVFVSSYTGEVSKVDTASLTVVKKSAVVGANLEGIAYRKNSIYVCNAWNSDYTYNSNLVKLSATTLEKEKDIVVVANPNQLIATEKDLYLASWGNYNDVKPTIQHIDLSDNVKTLAHATHMALGNGWLYLIGSTYDAEWNEVNTYTALNLETGEEVRFIDGREIDSPCAIGYDPISKLVIIASRKKYPNAEGKPTVSYTQDGYVACYTGGGMYVHHLDCGVNPGSLLFLSHSEKWPVY